MLLYRLLKSSQAQGVHSSPTCNCCSSDFAQACTKLHKPHRLPPTHTPTHIHTSRTTTQLRALTQSAKDLLNVLNSTLNRRPLRCYSTASGAVAALSASRCLRATRHDVVLPGHRHTGTGVHSLPNCRTTDRAPNHTAERSTNTRRIVKTSRR